LILVAGHNVKNACNFQKRIAQFIAVGSSQSEFGGKNPCLVLAGRVCRAESVITQLGDVDNSIFGMRQPQSSFSFTVFYHI
jgi:hypothetical protein